MLDEWDDDKLQSIVFSVEKTFCTDVSWRAKVYRLSNSRYHPNNLQMTSRSGRITNNYWGTIGYDGPLTDLVRIEGKFNSHKYMRVLRTHLLPIVQDIAPPRIFMQDNSPLHKANNVMGWFSRQNFEVLDWPELSPDLNPIENVWAFMEKGWPEVHPRNENTLDVVAQERWEMLRNNQGIAKTFKEFEYIIKIVPNLFLKCSRIFP